jgi:hypothetical protein
MLRAIAESWDDPSPVLAFANWAEERRIADPPLLRWYARAVMPAVASVPADCPPGPTAGRDRGRKALRLHPDAGLLSRWAAVAFCRRPCVWDQLPQVPGRQAVTVARLGALGLASAAERKALLKAAVGAEKEARSRLYTLCRPEVRASFAPPSLADEALKPVTRELCIHRLVASLMDAAGPAVARHVYRFADTYATVRAEMGYQKAVYEALARVPPLAPQQ